MSSVNNSTMIRDTLTMQIFGSAKSTKKGKIQSASDCQFVWKRVDTNFGVFFLEKDLEFRSKRKTTDISKQELIKVLHLSQRQAAKSLNCTLSTLKRRFYNLKEEFGMSTWPKTFKEISHLPIYQKMYPMSLNFILN
ncbi:predicted protein [Naegleria gruberi]|uniref:Predicted protein n=1 Tax=Naegleria gruberi TaxID=5762 RepID=D2VNM7_NAEGR|nr:uncharacterized protein NAEGRDRAFT_70553 [Naegleria gruberi]EFC41434.1 predicted protein [Naegleria gruberi]|eukprot:XP_002674178.1 predicted protein [Naegleria gruberi strain NEG-M]